MRLFFLLSALLLSMLAICFVPDEPTPPRRKLCVALYPFIPEKAELYWKLEREFMDNNPAIDLRYVETGANYYGSEPAKGLKAGRVDIAEVDTVMLPDLVADGLVSELPKTYLPKDTYFPVAEKAASIDDKIYGVPHWVCGNFLFYRKDDPKRRRFEDIQSLGDLERIIGRPVSEQQSLLIDLHGKSTLGEKYLDVMLDSYTPEEVLKKLEAGTLDDNALRCLDRLFALCPGGLCDSAKHHTFSPFYARQFAERKARAFIGYSERMFFVVEHYLNGVREDQPAVGKITWDEKTFLPIGTDDVGAVPATLSDKYSTTLTWVDVLCIRADADEQKMKDALVFIDFFNSSHFTLSALIPEYGHAPRYLLPARKCIYSNETLLKAAPLYSRFGEIMQNGITVSQKGINTKLRDVGRKIEARGFGPVK